MAHRDDESLEKVARFVISSPYEVPPTGTPSDRSLHPRGVPLNQEIAALSITRALVEKSLKAPRPPQIAHFALLFRGLIICALRMEASEDVSLEIVRQGVEIIHMTKGVKAVGPRSSRCMAPLSQNVVSRGRDCLDLGDML